MESPSGASGHPGSSLFQCLRPTSVLPSLLTALKPGAVLLDGGASVSGVPGPLSCALQLHRGAQPLREGVDYCFSPLSWQGHSHFSLTPVCTAGLQARGGSADTGRRKGMGARCESVGSPSLPHLSLCPGPSAAPLSFGSHALPATPDATPWPQREGFKVKPSAGPSLSPLQPQRPHLSNGDELCPLHAAKG